MLSIVCLGPRYKDSLRKSEGNVHLDEAEYHSRNIGERL